jgi:hypothetical protein
MNPKTQRAFERLARQMSRQSARPRGRISTAPLMLALGLVLGYQLLVRLVPRVWGTLLPGGWEQASMLRGWPGLVWRLAIACHLNFSLALAIGAVIVGAAIIVSGWIRPLRFLVWLAAVGVILLDAGIVYVTLRTALEASAHASGIF